MYRYIIRRTHQSTSHDHLKYNTYMYDFMNNRKLLKLDLI